MEVVNALEQYRRDAALDMREFAEQMGVPYETARRWCNGSREPRISQRALIKKGTKGAVEFVAGFVRKK